MTARFCWGSGDWGSESQESLTLDTRHISILEGPFAVVMTLLFSLDGTDMRGGNWRDMELAGLSKAVAAMDPCRG